jgi:hypothetical protein
MVPPAPAPRSIPKPLYNNLNKILFPLAIVGTLAASISWYNSILTRRAQAKDPRTKAKDYPAPL